MFAALGNLVTLTAGWAYQEIVFRSKVLKGEIYQNERFGLRGREQFRAREEMREQRDNVDKESHTWLLHFLSEVGLHTQIANAANDRPQVSSLHTQSMACASLRRCAWRLIPGDILESCTVSFAVGVGKSVNWLKEIVIVGRVYLSVQ